MRTFHPDKKVRAKPEHGGIVIYADDTCIRVLTAEMIGGGGMLEIMGSALILMGLPFWLLFSDFEINHDFFYFIVAGVIMILLDIILFRYRPNYLIFSRKSGEIYYQKSKKAIYRLKWKDITGRYARVAVFTGGGVSRNDYLRIAGISDYPDGSRIAVSIAFPVLDAQDAKELWAYFQAYMDHGPEGLQEAGVDNAAGDFLTVAKYQTKFWLYRLPAGFIYSVLHPQTLKQKLWSIIFIPATPLMLVVSTPVMWLTHVVIAFTNSTRSRAPMPEAFTNNITDNKQSYGTRTSFLVDED